VDGRRREEKGGGGRKGCPQLGSLDPLVVVSSIQRTSDQHVIGRGKFSYTVQTRCR